MGGAKGRTVLLQGNEACAMGAIYAGCRFFGGYPITPSTEIAEHFARKLPTVGGVFIQMEDEIASISAIIGASLAGVKSMTATSGPGFSLMQENLGLAAVLEAPVVIVNIMRSGASTGHPTGTGQADLMQSRWGTHGDHPVVVLAPATAQEMFALTVKAFNISEKLRLPVVLLPEAVVGHIREAVYIPTEGEMEVLDRKRPDSYENLLFFRRDENGVAHPPDLGTGHRPHYTGLTHDEDGFFTAEPGKVNAFTVGLNSKLELHSDLLTDYREDAVEDAEIVMVSFGVTARVCSHITRSLRKKGVKAGSFRPRIVWPFPEERLKQIAQNAHTFIVPELNLGQMRSTVQCAVGQDKRVVGINRVDGTMLTLERTLEEVKKVLN